MKIDLLKKGVRFGVAAAMLFGSDATAFARTRADSTIRSEKEQSVEYNVVDQYLELRSEIALRSVEMCSRVSYVRYDELTYDEKKQYKEFVGLVKPILAFMLKHSDIAKLREGLKSDQGGAVRDFRHVMHNLLRVRQLMDINQNAYCSFRLNEYK